MRLMGLNPNCLSVLGPTRNFFDSIFTMHKLADGIVVQDESSNFTKDGKFIWTIIPDTSSTTSFCLDSCDLP